MAERAFIGVGSNVGNHYSNCTRGIRETLSDKRSSLVALSSLYYTAPISTIPQHDILNGVFCMDWQGSADDLLCLLLNIETRMGRIRTVLNGPRVIDLDILLLGRSILQAPHLTVPHPRLHERKFALVPCLEIDPLLLHPVLGKSFDELLGLIDEVQPINRFCRIDENDVLPADGNEMIRTDRWE